MSATAIFDWYIATWVNAPRARHVADRPHAVGHPQVFVDREHSCRGGVDAEHVGADAREVDTPAGGHEQLFGDQLATARELHLELAVVGDVGGCGARDHVDALAAEDVGEQVARFGFLEREQTVECLDDGDVDAEAGVHLGEFRADRSAAEHDDRRRQCLGFDRLVIGPERGLGEPGDRRDTSGGAGGDDHGTCGPVSVSVDLDDVSGDESPATTNEGSALADEAVDRDGVVPVVGGLDSDPRGDRSPVGGHGRRAGETGDPARLGERVRRADHHLRRDATPVRALTADEARLDADDGQPGSGQVSGDVLAARAHPEHDDVDRRLVGRVDRAHTAPCPTMVPASEPASCTS
jgi:hypothetical protein